MKKNSKQRWLIRLSVSIAILIVVAFGVIAPIDYTPLEETDYYPVSKSILEQSMASPSDSTPVKAGWSKKSITPDFAFKVAGFGKNEYTRLILDSIFVRAVVFEQSNKQVVYLSLDLMIIHPYLQNHLTRSIQEAFPQVDFIYFSATHSHNSVGGYSDGIAGKIVLGGQSVEIMTLLTGQCLNAIGTSIKKLEPVQYNYSDFKTQNLVTNRIDKENGATDEKVRVLSLKNQSGKTAGIVTQAAHPTCLPRKLNGLSGDYPSELCRLLEQSEAFDWALFSAGAVGSMGPNVPDLSIEGKNRFAHKQFEFCLLAIQNRQFKPLNSMRFARVDIPLRESSLKLFGKYRLRPWAFSLVMGEAQGKLTFLEIGEVLLCGTPCDFSGELALRIEAQNVSTHHLMFTSFNGEYLGYITPDKYYNWDEHEVRDSNWFGPHNGRYFTESITAMIQKFN